MKGQFYVVFNPTNFDLGRLVEATADREQGHSTENPDAQFDETKGAEKPHARMWTAFRRMLNRARFTARGPIGRRSRPQ